MATNLERTAGLMEADVAYFSGLRRSTFSSHLVTNQTQLVNARPIGGTGGAIVSDWTRLTQAGNTIPFGGTLVAQVIQPTPIPAGVQFRVRGYNQFHEYVEEITPVVILAAKTNNFIYLAQSFVYVTSIDFHSGGLDIADDTVSIGQRWDWTRTIDGTNEHHAGLNLGIAIPFRLAGSQRPASAIGTPVGRPMTTMVHGGATDGAGTELNLPSPRGRNILASIGFANGETVTIDGKVYTMKNTITAADGDVLLGASLSEAVANLRSAIMRSPSGAGTQYGANTVAHPTVRLSSQQVDGVPSAIGVQARRPGSLSARIGVSTTSGTSAWQYGAALILGIDYPIEVQTIEVYDITGAAAVFAFLRVLPEHVLTGYSETGYSGCIEKVGFVLPDQVGQWAVADNVLVNCTVKTAELRS